MKFNKSLFRLSLPSQVVVGIILGIMMGLLIGDKAAVFEPVGRTYTMLMEVAVFPYLICTLLTSLGSLTPVLSMKLFSKGGVIYLFLLLLTFATLLILAQALPIDVAPFAQASTSAIGQSQILKFLIPENFFHDLAQNFVPAIIIFCILFGLTLQFVPNKTTFFNVLDVISHTCLLFWKWLIRLAPLATFALIAYVAGTVKLSQLYDLGEFLILFIIGTTLLIFWILPITISSVTNINYKSILSGLRDALIISAVTTLSVVALPYIQAFITKLLSKKKSLKANKMDGEEKEDIIKTILLVGYPFAQLGNFFIYLFMLFTAIYFDHVLTRQQYVFLPILSFFSAIGSPTSSINAVSFLAQWLNLPDDTANLYVTLMPIIRYPQVLLSVMGFAFISIIFSFSFFGHLKINYKKLTIHYVAFFILIIISSFFLKNVFPNSGEKSYNRLNSFLLDADLVQGVKATILPLNEDKAPKNTTEDALFRIQRTGILRVGFNTDMRPFSFYNDKQDLVGYDISYAYALAKALNSRIEFVPFTWQNLVTDLLADKFDIAMSAIYVTEQRLQAASFTTPYFHSDLSLIVPKAQQGQFGSAEEIKAIPNLKIGTFNDPVLIPLIQHNFPKASIVIFPSLSSDLPEQAFKRNQIDAIIWSEAQTRVWVLAHPNYVSIVPSGVAAPFLMAYMIQRNSPQFLRFLNYWLELKENDGFQQQMVNQWILIRPVKDNKPRWSLMGAMLP